MSDQPILASGLKQVAQSIEPLDDDDKAVIAASGDNAGYRIGGAVDLGQGFQAGGHVEKVAGVKGVGWFAGLVKRWKR